MAHGLEYILYASLLIHIVLLGIVTVRVVRGENSVDRLIGTDLAGTLSIGILVLVAMIHGQTIYIDVALGLAALGFVGIVALARYLVDERIF